MTFCGLCLDECLAEALCEAQHFAEAAELFRCVLAALRSSAERDAMRSVEAEVWAHLGVAMQRPDVKLITFNTKNDREM